MPGVDKNTEYTLPSELKDRIYDLRRLSLVYCLFLIALDHILIWLPSALIFFYKPQLIYWYPLVWVVSIRSMRGLECLVHEASHYNVTKNKAINDIIGNVFAAFPVFSNVNNYRISHTRHHSQLGRNGDPDLPRHIDLNLTEIDRARPIQFTIRILACLPSYVPGWWKAIGTTWKIFLVGVLWHTTFVILPATVFGGLEVALYFWTLTYFVPFFFFLPILRLIGEAAEHDYTEEQCIALTTFSNTGIIHRLVFHPHGDGYHTLHHLFPFIPHYRLHKLDALLASHDRECWQQYLRNRRKVFQNA